MLAATAANQHMAMQSHPDPFQNDNSPSTPLHAYLASLAFLLPAIAYVLYADRSMKKK